MAVSETSISNLALQKLGAARIVNLTEDSRNARECNACYEPLRDRELRANAWKFAITRVILAPAGTVPAFEFLYAFALPSDCLRVLLPNTPNLDWTIESIGGSSHILTNDGTAINVRYIWKVTDPTRFDPLFVEMLACKMAWHMCEVLTQSNQKKSDAVAEYKDVRREARQMNAFEKIAAEPGTDLWDIARIGGGVNRNWLKFG